MRRYLATLAVALVTLGMVLSTAAAQKTITLRLSTPTATNDPETTGPQKFADLVTKYTNGTVQVKVFPNNQLGSPQAVAQGIQLGTIDIGEIASAHLVSYDSKLSALDLPFLFKNAQDAYAKLDGPLGVELAKPLEKKNMLLLGYFSGGFRDLLDSKGPLNSPAAIKAEHIRIRVMNSPVYISFAKAIGAVPAPLPWNEVYTDLQQGVIDAAETGIATNYDQKFYEQAKYVTLDQHTFTAMALVMSLRKYNQLTASQQAAVKKAAAEAITFEHKAEEAAIQKARTAMEAKGVVFTKADKAAFQAAVKPVWAQAEKKLGAKLIQELSQ